MLMEFLEFTFKNFYHFIGVFIILNLLCSTIVKIIYAIFRYQEKETKYDNINEEITDAEYKEVGEE